MDNLSGFYKKIKGGLHELADLKDFSVPVIIILTALASFGLGRLSGLDRENDGFFMIDATSSSVLSSDNPIKSGMDIPAAINSGGKLVGSKNGNKYHYPWCSGALRISEENKVWFDGVDEARAAGYEPAGNCKGLQ